MSTNESKLKKILILRIDNINCICDNDLRDKYTIANYIKDEKSIKLISDEMILRNMVI